MKIPQGDFIASGHIMERVDPARRIRYTVSADSSGDQGATSLNGLAHLDGVMGTKTGMLVRDQVTSKSAMNVTPHGQGYMRSSFQKSCYMEGQSGEGGTPALLNPLALAYHFCPVKSTPDRPEVMVPANSCDENTGRNQAMSAPTTVEACPLEKRGVPTPARSRPSVIIGRRPPTVFEEKGFKSDGADKNISVRSTAPSFGDKKGGFSRKKIPNLHKVARALAIFFSDGTKKLKLLQKVA